MREVGGRFWGAAIAAALVLTAGCQAENSDSEGADAPLLHLRGELNPDEQWPARGSLTGDAALIAEVSQVVDQWQTPDGVGRHARSALTSIAWLGEVDGLVLAVVAFAPDNTSNNRWVVEVSGLPGSLTVTEARDIRTRIGKDFVDTEVVPIRSPGIGPRYLVSERIVRLSADSVQLTITDGLTERAEVGRCAMVELMADLGDGHIIYGDLGTEVQSPTYPLFYAQVLPPDGISDVARLRDVDTCTGAAETEWLGSLRELLAPEIPAVLSWQELTEINSGDFHGTLEEVPVWGSGWDLRALVIMWRPASGPPVLSPGELDDLRSEVLTFVFDTAEGPLAVLRTPPGTPTTPPRGLRDVRVPTEATLLVNDPRFVAIALPDHEIEISYTRDGEREQVTVEAP